MTYQIVTENGRSSRGQKVSFSITVGLQEGYGDDGRLHTSEEVIAAYHAWAEARARQERPFLTGTATQGVVAYAYAWKNEDGSVGGTGGGQEPNIAFAGELSHLYNEPLIANLALAEEVLNELASVLGTATGQTRIYVSLGQENWVIQAEGKETPTGEGETV